MLHIDKTLIEQLQITDFEIQRRKELLGFAPEDVEALISCKALVGNNIDSIVTDFYKKQIAAEEIALLIGDADTLFRLHAAQRAYVLNLFEGYYDLDYVNNRLRIGMVHKRIGVEPKLYLSAVKTLKDSICIELEHQLDDKAHLRRVVAALEKLLYFDTTLVFDTYIRGLLSEVELAKSKVQVYAKELEAKVAERTRQLEELSLRDALTGLFNRRKLHDALRRELTLAKRYRRHFSLVYFDVDDFKLINDSRGHFAGDEVLRAVGDALKAVSREVDYPCRYGGDEFCLGLPDCSLVAAEAICQRLIEQFSAKHPEVTFSVGIAQVGPDDFPGPDELLRSADRKMYEAKAHPGFKVCT